MEKKFKLTTETKELDGVVLYRIQALKEFYDIKKGDLGGWVETEGNLSQDENAWISENALVYENAWVFGNARVSGNARVFGSGMVYENAWVFGDAMVSGNARVFGSGMVYGSGMVFESGMVSGNAWISEDAWVSGYARVSGNARIFGDAKIYKNFPLSNRSDGYSFIIVPDKNNILRIIAGCRYFTIEEARSHWTNTRMGTQLGEESLAIVDHLEKMAKIVYNNDNIGG